MPDSDVPATAPQCWCCAFYGLYRAAVAAHGLCLMCTLLPQLCERGHRMAAKYERGAGA